MLNKLVPKFTFPSYILRTKLFKQFTPLLMYNIPVTSVIFVVSFQYDRDWVLYDVHIVLLQII